MRTPEEYTKNLKNGIVTTEMLRDVLYSTNKRAKNHRDKEREYRHAYGKYSVANMEKYKESKEKSYRTKEDLLSFLDPICIHREFAGYERVRVYDYESFFWDRYAEHSLRRDIVWQNSYLDRDSYTEVFFFDYEIGEPTYRYYLFYVCGNRSFHHPITEAEISSYNLDVVDIGHLDTYGEDILELLSMQFSQKVLAALKSGEATYTKTLPDTPPEFPYEPQLQRSGEITKSSICHAMKNILKDRIVNAVFAMTDECGDVDVWKKGFSIHQVYRKKKNIYKRPQVNWKKQWGIINTLTNDPMLDFLHEKLNGYQGDHLIPYFVEQCVSPDSPVYHELLQSAKEHNSFSTARKLLAEAADGLYKQDQSRQIINDNGVVRYSGA